MKEAPLKRFKLATVSCAVALACCPSRVQADPIVFNTFGPGFSYNTSAGWGVDGIGTFHAFRFVPTRSGVLDRITVALDGVDNIEQQAACPATSRRRRLR
jgi:hypothetical protein